MFGESLCICVLVCGVWRFGLRGKEKQKVKGRLGYEGGEEWYREVDLKGNH